MNDFLKYLILFFIINNISFSLEEVILTNNSEIYIIGDRIEVYEDKSCNLQIENFINDINKYKFKKSNSKNPNYGFTKSNYWVRFKIQNLSSNFNWFLEIQCAPFDNIDFYIIQTNHVIFEKKLNKNVKRDIDYHHYVFQFEIEKYKENIIYLKLKSNNAMRFPISLYTIRAFLNNKSNVRLYLGLYFGMILIIIFYNFIIFVFIKDINYLYCILFLFSILFFQLNEVGVAYKLWKILPWTVDRYIFISTSLMSLFGLLFTKSFLNIRILLPKLNKIFNIFIFINLLNTLLILFYHIPLDILTIINSISLFLVLYSSIITYIKKNKYARYFILAWGADLFGLTIKIFSGFGILPHNVFTFFSFYVGTILGVILFSLSLIDRFNLVKEEKEKAQQVIIENLHKIDKLKDEFLANTTHELKTPLNGIIGITESLIDGAAGEINEKMKNDLLLVIYSGKRLLNLINDILDFSKLKHEDVILKTTIIDLKTSVDISFELTSHLLNGKDIKFINNIPENTLIKADENRIQQILINLISNSIKFTDEGFIEISSKILDKFIEVTVKDTGIGIPEDKQSKIFEPFFQADSSISKEYSGIGLGLSITKKLIELHGGNIKVESKLNEGSKFIFTLPLADQEIIESSDLKEKRTSFKSEEIRQTIISDSVLKEKEIKDNLKQENNKYKYNIMIVDDDPINLIVLENQLKLYGYQIIKANNGKDALDFIDKGIKPDLILLDIMMPKISGYDVVKKIREKYSKDDLQIILLTIRNQINDIIRGFEVGANDYLTKPFDKLELLVRINNLLTLKESINKTKKLLLMEQELEFAQKIQNSILPKNINTKFMHCYIESAYIPMEMIGGDFFDFHIADNGNIGIVISDVSGHGIPAAIVSTMLKIAFHIVEKYIDNPSELLLNMNKILIDKSGGQFITAGYLYLDFNKNKLYYSNAGHPPLLIVNEKGLKILKPKGKPLGVYDNISFETEEYIFSKKDKIILFTDGIIETIDNDENEFSENRLYEIIKSKYYLNNRELIDYIIKELKKWSGKSSFNDDIAIIIIEII